MKPDKQSPAQVEVTDEMVRAAAMRMITALPDVAIGAIRTAGYSLDEIVRSVLAAALTATDAKLACPVCNETFRADDPCATDIELGTCHAACLEGAPTVDLDTGDPVDGPIPTYRYGEDAKPVRCPQCDLGLGGHEPGCPNAKPVVPAEPVAGWKLLPVEPDDGMIEAGQEEIACRKQHGMQVFASDIYEAMVAAAPAAALASEGKTDA